MVTTGRRRMIKCKKCGADFSCQPEGACWCMEKPRGLPVPTDDQAGCLCPVCLDALTNQGPETERRSSGNSQ
ncbi:hypothetical protein CFR72_14745 [Gluconacetobacter entanii]|uniref:Cysteine-rich CWC family protein n=1 Tax=Gluconacetobacter entanii TaxID=108528 RepID=A0A318PP48_9PROT|nr:hypothetical protein CFR72_14745 [Gluconacetobacter entanii]